MVTTEHSYELLQVLEDTVRHIWEEVVAQWREGPLPGEPEGERCPYPEPFLDRHLTLVVARRTLTMLSELMETIFNFYQNNRAHLGGGGAGLSYPSLARLARRFTTVPAAAVDAMEGRMRKIFPRGIESLNLTIYGFRNDAVLDHRTREDLQFQAAYLGYRRFDAQPVGPQNIRNLTKRTRGPSPKQLASSEHGRRVRAMSKRIRAKLKELVERGLIGSVAVLVGNEADNAFEAAMAGRKLLEREVLEGGQPSKIMCVYEGLEVPSSIALETLVNGAVRKEDGMYKFRGPRGHYIKF